MGKQYLGRQDSDKGGPEVGGQYLGRQPCSGVVDPIPSTSPPQEPCSGVAICRSSQPKVGVQMARSNHDVRLLQAILEANAFSDRLHFIDCR